MILSLTLTTYQFANYIKSTHIYSVFNLIILFKNHRLILCGTLCYSVFAVKKKKYQAKLIGASSLT